MIDFLIITFCIIIVLIGFNKFINEFKSKKTCCGSDCSKCCVNYNCTTNPTTHKKEFPND